MAVHPLTARAAPPREQAVFQLQVNGQTGEDVVVWLSEKDVLVPIDALRRAGVLRLRAGFQRLQGVDYVSLARSSPKLSYSVDAADLTLSISAPPAALGDVRVDLGSAKPAGLWYSDDLGVYLNYAPSLLDLTHFRAYADAGLSAGWLRLSSSASYEERNGAVRLLSQAILSDRKHLRDVTLGDNYASTGPLGGGGLLAGFALARNFELDPYLVHVPTLGYQGSVIAPSTVDVYVNDVLVRRVDIAPGDFQLRGVAPSSGSGNVRYVIRDAMGGQREVRAQYYSGSAALGRGVTEYVYSAGFLRTRYGLESFSYGDPALLARYRFGLDGRLTLGAHTELAPAHMSFGSELLLATSFGEVEFGAASSVDRARGFSRGSAGLVAYSYRAGAASLRSSFKLTSGRYSTVGLLAWADRNLFEHSSSASFALGRHVSLAMLVGIGWARDAGPNAQSSVRLSAQLLRGLFTQLSAIRTDTAGLQSEYSLFASLNVQLPFEHTASLSEQLSSQRPETAVSVSRPLIGQTGVGYQASARWGETSHYAVNLQSQTSFLRASGSFFNDAGRSASLIDAAGMLVWMPGAGVFFSRPVAQSFAVVDVPNSPGMDGYLNNHFMGKTNASGKLFMPDLLSYYGNRIRVEDPEMGVGDEVDDEEVLIAPPARGGAHVVIERRRLQLLRGTLVPQGLELGAIRYGELALSVDGRKLSSPVGVNGEFELDGVPPGEWRAKVVGPESSCEAVLFVSRTRAPIEQLGKVPCAPSAEPH